jgi:flagella synthesis protein FlgN
MAQLRAKLDACQAQNDINDRLLELSILTNRRLATFLSQLRDRNSLTYDAKGNTRSGTRSYGIKA